MTTFTTEDRIIAEKDGSFTVNAAPPHIVDSGSSVQLYRDVKFPGFSLRFTKQGDNWVCSLPEWLLDKAIAVANGLSNEDK